jgi:hypothetical protein
MVWWVKIDAPGFLRHIIRIANVSGVCPSVVVDGV